MPWSFIIPAAVSLFSASQNRSAASQASDAATRASENSQALQYQMFQEGIARTLAYSRYQCVGQDATAVWQYAPRVYGTSRFDARPWLCVSISGRRKNIRAKCGGTKWRNVRQRVKKCNTFWTRLWVTRVPKRFWSSADGLQRQRSAGSYRLQPFGVYGRLGPDFSQYADKRRRHVWHECRQRHDQPRCQYRQRNHGRDTGNDVRIWRHRQSIWAHQS